MATNLQNKLGLGLAEVQSANMRARAYNIANASEPGRFQIEGGIAGGSQGEIGQQQLSPPTSYGDNQNIAPISQGISLEGYSTPSISTPQGELGKIGSIAGVTKKKNTNIAEVAPQIAKIEPIAPSEEQNVMGFNDATKGQDVQFRQSYRQAMNQPTKAPLDESGLSSAELQAYKMLTPQEQAQYKALATQGMKAQTDYLTKSKANMEFQKSQEEQRLAMEENADAISDMMSKKNIEESQKQVANLKQNIGYLGSGGQPGVSSQKLDAISNQVTLADRTLKNIIEAERLQKANREIGQEKNAEIFTRQIKILQDDLDSKVNKTIQGALNTFNSAELEGKLDTIPEIEAFQQQLYAQLDGDLSSIMDTNIQARQFLIERYDKLAESQKAQMQAQEKAKADYQKNANTLNKEMSEALGYYVNANGEALVDRKTGQNIVVPPETTTNYDASTGQMILMTKNRDGSIGVQIKQVGQGKPTEWKESTQQPGMAFDPNTGIYKSATTGGMLNIPRTGNNVGQDTNNPGNIMGDTEGQKSIATKLGAIGFYQSPNGRTYAVFPDMQTGVQASLADLQTKLNGGSSWATPDTTLAKFASGWVSGPNAQINQNAVNNYVKLTGASANTPIKNIPLETLAKAVFANEGVDISKSANLSGVTGTQGATQPATGGLADDINVKVANIGNIAFGRTMSDAEGKRVESIIKKNPNASVNDIALAVRGLNIDNEEDKPTALEYIGVFDKISENVKPKGFEMTISKYINSGDYKGLNNFVSKYVENDAKATTPADQFISTPENNKVTKNIDEVIKLINANKDKIGAVDGRYTQLVKKFQSEPDIQKLQTLMTGTFADLRKNFAGSAVTATELTALEDFIAGSTTEVPENLITKLKTLKDVQTGLYKDQRSMYQLPNVKALEAKKWFEGFSLSDILSKLN